MFHLLNSKRSYTFVNEFNNYKFCHQIKINEELSEKEEEILQQILSFFPHSDNGDWAKKLPLLNPGDFPKRLLTMAANAYAHSISVLSVAAEYGDPALLQLLINLGANVNQFDCGPNPSQEYYNKVPLHWAISNQFSIKDKNSRHAAQILQHLLDNHANSNLVCYLGKTPLEYARERKYNAAVSLIENHHKKIVAFTRGATAGLFKNFFHWDVAEKISFFLDRKDGIQISRTCQNAYLLAKEEEEKSIRLLKFT